MDASSSPGTQPRRSSIAIRKQRPAHAVVATAPVPVAVISRRLLNAAIVARFLVASRYPWPPSDAEEPPPKDCEWSAPPRRACAASACNRPHDGAKVDRDGYRIRLLGPVAVAGREQQLGAAGRARELLALLAVTDGHRATRDRIRAKLGPHPDRPMTEGYFRQTCTRARALLGAAPDGRSLLLYDHGTYTLHDQVAVDWDQFQVLVAHGKADGPEGVEDLRRALSLVRGEPLEDCGYRWIEPVLIEHMRASVVQTAGFLASTSADDPATAAWAACRGLLADPYAEQLYRVLMTAASALGHTRGVHLAYELCQQALAILDLAPHEQTTTLYHDLTSV